MNDLANRVESLLWDYYRMTTPPTLSHQAAHIIALTHEGYVDERVSAANEQPTGRTEDAERVEYARLVVENAKWSAAHERLRCALDMLRPVLSGSPYLVDEAIAQIEKLIRDHNDLSIQLATANNNISEWARGHAVLLEKNSELQMEAIALRGEVTSAAREKDNSWFVNRRLEADRDAIHREFKEHLDSCRTAGRV